MMFDNEERKLERLNSGFTDLISARTYNMIIGLVLAYGLLLNAFIVMYCSNFFRSINYLIFLIGYFICCFAGITIANVSRNPAISFLGYNLVVLPIGGLLSIFVPEFYIQDIIYAAFLTGVIMIVMTLLATIKPSLFANMGPALFISLFLGLIAEIIALLFGYAGSIFNWLFVIIFSLYVGYDWMKAQAYPKTIDNAVDSSLDIYLDIINLFVRLLSILGKSKSRK